MGFIYPRMAIYAELPPLILEAQKTGEAAPGDPELLATAYSALFQGYTLFVLHNEKLKEAITPEIFTNVLRNKG
jgi:hypothetical protein